jgi:chromosome segregation ATPase
MGAAIIREQFFSQINDLLKQSGDLAHEDTTLEELKRAYLEFLNTKDDRKKDEEKEELRDIYVDAALHIIDKQIEAVQAEIVDLRKKNEEIREQIKIEGIQLNKANKELTYILEEMRQTNEIFDLQIAQKEDRISEISIEIVELENEQIFLNSDINLKAAQIDADNENMDALQGGRQALLDEKQKLEPLRDLYAQMETATGAKKADLQEKITAMEVGLGFKYGSLAVIDQNIKNIDQGIAGLDHAKKVIQEDASDKHEEIDALRGKKGKIEDAITSLKTEKEKLEKEILDLEAQKQQNTEKYKALIAAKKEEIAQIEEKIKILQTQYDENERKIGELEAREADLKAQKAEVGAQKPGAAPQAAANPHGPAGTDGALRPVFAANADPAPEVTRVVEPGAPAANAETFEPVAKASAAPGVAAA